MRICSSPALPKSMQQSNKRVRDIFHPNEMSPTTFLLALQNKFQQDMPPNAYINLYFLLLFDPLAIVQ
jgi:hypothetical protein